MAEERSRATQVGPGGDATEAWPPLALEAWRETYGTLHMLTQVVGKIRLACSPALNHWWHVPLYVTARGLTTSAMPYGPRTFQIDFDLVDHRLRVDVSDGGRASFSILEKSVAAFYRELMATLQALDVPVTIWTRPVEVAEPIPFEQDDRHTAYEPERAHGFWQVLRQAHRVLEEFRSGFVGKSSPVHFFWGSFDLAVTRFSGRRAPVHPGGVPNLADRVVREAYSHECSSCGFWPGSGAVQEAAFYAYAYPEPEGYRAHPAGPPEASYVDEMREFILPYEAIRQSADADGTLHDFLRSTYEAAADLGGWNRKELEDSVPAPERASARSPSFPHPQVDNEATWRTRQR